MDDPREWLQEINELAAEEQAEIHALMAETAETDRVEAIRLLDTIAS